MAKFEYRKHVDRTGFVEIVRHKLETHEYQMWTSGRQEWFSHEDAPGVFIGFADGIWHKISEEEALKTIEQFGEQS